MELFEDVFYYDETSPSCLRWKEDRWTGRTYSTKAASKDSPAGGLVSGGYWAIFLNGKLETAHRLIYEHFNGEIPDGMNIDHINGNRKDNRIENLRLADYKTNARNRKKRFDSQTGVTGVYLHKGSYQEYRYVAASCCEDGKVKVKLFSIKKLGFEEAFQQACAYRKEMIERLNLKGFGYTDDHGKRGSD